MAEGAGAEGSAATHETTLPFRMADMTLQSPLPAHLPMAEAVNTVRKELMFHWKLLKEEWTKTHYATIVFGLVALILGSVSTELWNGGDAKVSGVDGVLAIDGFQFFQLLISIICWGWFAYQAWMLFPVMRIHAISLLVMWNGMIGAQIFFYRTNPSFPLGLNLADMMEGTLILLVVFFFLFFFWKAVVETRDLHVEVNHLHEDVRVMEEALAEHSLRGWTALLGCWVFLIIMSSWAGLRHVATYGDNSLGFLVLHLLTGLPAIPILIFVLWYPQRMLGNQASVRTRAAVDASLEMSGEAPVKQKSIAACPECHAPSPLSLNNSGELTHPCRSPGCGTSVVVGNSCAACESPMPSRIACSSCGVNAPALDYMPDQEAW
ncbi:MAG: hypothetical protein VW872_03350 [Candidatus Poseidoniales archaeon]